MLGKTSNSLGNKIRGRREQLGLTQRELADRAGIPLRTLQDIEWDKGDPRLSNIEKIGDVLGVGFARQPGVPEKPSPSSVTGPLTAEDGALILARLASATPAQRALALTILFEEPEFLKDFELPKELVPSILGAVKVK